MDFLVKHFIVLGVDFQYWMPLVIGACAQDRPAEARARNVGAAPLGTLCGLGRYPASVGDGLSNRGLVGRQLNSPFILVVVHARHHHRRWAI